MASIPLTNAENTGIVESGKFKFHHFLELDGFRGVAILLVITGHVLEKDFHVKTDLGELGVLLFFILSGFLITGLLQREEVKTGRISLRAFYIRRILRIFPALYFYLAVLCTLIVTRLVTDTPWYAVAASMLFVRNIWGRGAGAGHLWSLSLEEQFYAVWPWTIRQFGSRTAFWIAALGATFVSVFRMLSIQQGWFSHGFAGTYYYRPWFRFDSVLVGCAIVLLLSRCSGEQPWRKYLGSSTVAILCWTALLFWTIQGESLSRVWHLTLQTVLASVVFLNLVVHQGSLLQSFFRIAWLRWIGRISYSWYLWQQLFTQYSDPRWGAVCKFPLNIGFSLILALLSYTYIEKPILRFKNRFH